VVDRRGLLASLDLRSRQNGNTIETAAKNKQRSYTPNGQICSISNPSKHINLPCRVQEHKQSFAIRSKELSSDLALVAYHPPAVATRQCIQPAFSSVHAYRLRPFVYSSCYHLLSELCQILILGKQAIIGSESDTAQQSLRDD